ncbi:MAG TPA: CZB domain-containing protein [Burkholderiaceae bacterium]|nr:CZB domain-containing protein [Burkholderiaceae bacterium]HMZ02096.1 CZB domain-containing protein [Burkholderiaceae bacterium]HNB43713.1 CZB domain-containing protein [Burkholderiaceae bacterium]HNG81424.1 CZB domain-containing protein [Burkholderiaceae bacterium]
MEWKARLRNAALRNEPLDVATIRRDDCCPLGQWLHGEGRKIWSTQPRFVALVDRHREFHVETGSVAATITRGAKDEGLKMLGGGTPFAQATQAVVMAIKALINERPPAEKTNERTNERTRPAAASSTPPATQRAAGPRSLPTQPVPAPSPPARAAADEWTTF